MNLHAEWLTQYGYIGLFIGLALGILALPVPDETMLAFSGYLIYKGAFHWPQTCVAGFLGSACGITLGYFLGRTLGDRAVGLVGRLVHAEASHVERTRHLVERIGEWILPVGYFIPTVRHLTAIVAGSARMPWPRFALLAYSGGLVWSQTFIVLGYVFGPKWDSVMRSVASGQTAALAAVAAALLILAVRFMVRRSRSPRPLS